MGDLLLPPVLVLLLLLPGLLLRLLFLLLLWLLLGTLLRLLFLLFLRLLLSTLLRLLLLSLLLLWLLLSALLRLLSLLLLRLLLLFFRLGLLLLFLGLSVLSALVLLRIQGSKCSEKQEQNSRADKSDSFHPSTSITNSSVLSILLHETFSSQSGPGHHLPFAPITSKTTPATTARPPSMGGMEIRS